MWRTGGRARGDSRHRRRRRNKVRKRLENYRRGAKKKRAIIGGKGGRQGKSGKMEGRSKGADILITATLQSRREPKVLFFVEWGESFFS